MKTKFLPSILALIAGVTVRATEIDAESQRLIGLETAELVAKSLPPEATVYGSVLSPAPLIDLIRQIELAKAALEISKQTAERVRKLFGSGELVARKDVEAADAQLVRDQAAIQTLEDRLVLEWGARFSSLSTAARTKLLENLLAGRVAVVRLSVARSETINGMPLAANLHAFGQEMKPIRCTPISPATTVDPAFQSRGFLGVVETPDSPLAIGLILTGSLELKGESRAGVVVPAGAVVFYLGKAWIYQKIDGNEFERVGISVDSPVDGGWFLADDVMKKHPVVTKGAQSILSQETAAPAGE